MSKIKSKHDYLNCKYNDKYNKRIIIKINFITYLQYL